MRGRKLREQIWYYLPTSQQKQSNCNGPKGSRRLRLQEFLDIGPLSGKIVSPMNRPPLPPGDIPSLALIYVKGWVITKAIVRPEGLSRWKIWMIPSGREPANYCATASPLHFTARNDFFPFNSSVYPISTPVISEITLCAERVHRRLFYQFSGFSSCYVTKTPVSIFDSQDG
jgi:hypothetical protein